MRNSIKETREHLTEYAKPSKGAGGKTGLWRTFRPTIISDKCKKCMLCWQFCPEGAISKGKDGYPEIDYTYCKGCGICAHECKPKAIKMKREGG